MSTDSILQIQDDVNSPTYNGLNAFYSPLHNGTPFDAVESLINNFEGKIGVVCQIGITRSKILAEHVTAINSNRLANFHKQNDKIYGFGVQRSLYSPSFLEDTFKVSNSNLIVNGEEVNLLILAIDPYKDEDSYETYCNFINHLNIINPQNLILFCMHIREVDVEG